MADSRTTIDAYFAGVNEDRFDDVAALFADGGTLTAPGVEPLARDGIAGYLTAALAPYPVHRDEPTRVVQSGSTATVEITFTGELVGGAPLTFEALDVFDLDADGRIARLVTWYDSHLVRGRLRAARQAASGPAPARPAGAMLTREDRGATAWLTLDRPEKLNAMPRSFWGEVTAAMRDIEADDAIRAAVFSGAGRCFSVGGDIEDFGALGGVADRRAYMREALGAYRVVEALPKPTIAAVHGHALGGGCELTLVCDIVVADETARFGTPESAVGLVPGLGVVRGLSQANLHWMKYLVMTGLPIDAGQALTAGLVNRVVGAGEHLAAAQELADTIAQRSPLAIAVGKEILGRGSWEGYQHAVEAISLLQSADDFGEGMAAFAEGREPRFGP